MAIKKYLGVAPPIDTVPGECLNLVVTQRTLHGVVLAPASPIHQWFAGTLTQAPTDREISVTINMAGKDLGGFHVQTGKWVGLRPLLTYGDPASPACYTWYAKDAAGQWRDGEGKAAGDAALPEQSAMPAALAREFLSAEDDYWQPWRELEEGEACAEAQTFCFRHRFAAATATIALHVPFPDAQFSALCARLRATPPPGIFIDDIGVTRGGRALRVIRVDDPANPIPLLPGPRVAHPDGSARVRMSIHERPGAHKPGTRRVILVTAREHATEHTGSWVVQGILRALAAPTAEAARWRKDTTWLLVPLYDPDGGATSSMHDLTNHFFNHHDDTPQGGATPGEVVAYAHYLRLFVNSERPIDLAATFYGLECNEAEPVCCPSAVRPDLALSLAFNRAWFRALHRGGLHTGKPAPWGTGWVPHRLHGWCGYLYGGLVLPFEVNDRYPTQRLTLRDVERIGHDFVPAVHAFLAQPAMAARMRQTRDFLRDRRQNMDLWYCTSMAGTLEEPTLHDLLALGY